ncbi:MAG TPA: RagB/SusD family nutrient uptake outer membrane protein, partial [Longimicrobiales bacterium]|nr:RagB/SusD family nutrient uptake outer membrane protein [Longimicrobiales bacterium]
TGLVGDELDDGSLSESFWDFDRRTLSAARGQYAAFECGSILPGNYMALSAARFQADNVLALLDGWSAEEVPNRTALMAEAAAYAGYSLVLLGEVMCSAALDTGPELTRPELWEAALDRFDRAAAAAESAGDTEIQNLVRVGQARALLNLGRLQEAGDLAALVPEGFNVVATFSDASARRQNRLYTAMYRNPVATVSATYRDLDFEGVADPRVVVVDAGISANDGDVPLFQPAKYGDVSSPITVASWEEAQLILAESLLAEGDASGAADILSGLHTRAGLPAYGGGTAAEVEAHLVEERRRELFLEGQRLNDMIRLDLELVPAPGEPFHRGGLYGDQLCFPLPDQERNNNPNI